MEIELYPHQKEALGILEGNGYRGYIALPPGLGKTLIGASAIKMAGSRRPLIVAPKSAFMSWEKELGRLGIQNATVVNYERFLINHKKTGTLPDTDFLILDEAHRAKNIKAKTTRLLMEYGKQPIPKVLLSGTPYKHLLDLYTQLFIISPSITGHYRDFVSRYFSIEENPWGGVDYKPLKDAERMILERAGRYFYRKDRSEIKGIEKVEVPVQVETPQAYSWSVFKDGVVMEVLDEGYTGDEAIGEIVKRLRGKFIHMMRLAQLNNREKHEYIADFVADNPDTVIFTLFKDEAYMIGKMVGGYVITSQTSAKERQQIVRKQDKPLVFTQALSEGADLVGYRNMIFACVPSSTIMFHQVAGRIDRLSQKAGLLTYVYLLDEYNSKFYTLLKERRQSNDYFNEIIDMMVRQIWRERKSETLKV